MEKEGYFLLEAGNLEGDDQSDLSLLKSFVLNKSKVDKNRQLIYIRTCYTINNRGDVYEK